MARTAWTKARTFRGSFLPRVQLGQSAALYCRVSTADQTWRAARIVNCSGVGADLAQFPRIYNPFKQARSFDPSGTYLRRWIPELANAADADILDTNAVQRRRQLALPLFEDARYPAPVLDHDSIARAFLARYAKFKSASAGSTATR